MWTKVKWFFGVLGWLLLGVLVALKAFLFKDRSKDGTPDHPTAKDLLVKQQAKVDQTKKAVEKTATDYKETSNEKDISDLIDDYNDLYNP